MLRHAHAAASCVRIAFPSIRHLSIRISLTRDPSSQKTWHLIVKRLSAVFTTQKIIAYQTTATIKSNRTATVTLPNRTKSRAHLHFLKRSLHPIKEFAFYTAHPKMATSAASTGPIPAASSSSSAQSSNNQTGPTPEELQTAFDNAIWYLLSLWHPLHIAVSSSWGGPDSADKRDWFAGAVSDLL